MAGYFEVGVFQPKREHNVGTLWRSAVQLGAAGIFTIGRRYKLQTSDVLKAEENIPLKHSLTLADFLESRPAEITLVAVEMGGMPLSRFRHPERAIYLLGAEDN